MTTIYSWRCSCDHAPLTYFTTTDDIVGSIKLAGTDEDFLEVEHAPNCAAYAHGLWEDKDGQPCWLCYPDTNDTEYADLDDAIRELVRASG